MTDKERDEALIAIDEAFDMLGGISDASEARDKLLVAMRALRGDEPAKPDRYLQVWKEAKAAYIRPNQTEHESDQAAAAVLRRHFDELRAEIEAEHLEFCETHERLNRVQRDHIRKLETERRIEPATNGEPDRWTLAMRECLQVSALECNKADAIAGKFDNESYVLDQVAALRKHFPEGPAVVVPMSAKMWAESVLNLRGAINATCEREAARFILSLDGAGYEYADGGALTVNTTLLTVETDDILALKRELEKCQTECRKPA